MSSWTPFIAISRPSDCQKCKGRYDNDHMLQRELIHIAVKYGPSAAEEELNERYAEWHVADHPMKG